MIQVNKDFLKNENYIKTVIEKAKKEIEKAKKEMRKKQARYNRYTRSASRKDVDVAIEYYATTIATGYFAGVAPEITINKKQTKRKYQYLKSCLIK
jgi:predicted ATP-dependent endonuclease of OLD family